MNRLFFLLICIIINIYNSYQQSYTCSPIKNIEYFGNDLQTITVASLSDCCLLCIQNAQCQAYTFTIVTTATTGNLCKLKFAIGSNFRCVANSYSGTRPQLVPTVTIPTAPTVTINPFTTTTTPIRQSFCVDNPNAAFNIVNYVVLNTVRVPSVSACCNVCASVAACGAYNYDTVNQNCLLISGTFSQTSTPENSNVSGTIAGVVVIRAPVKRQN